MSVDRLPSSACPPPAGSAPPGAVFLSYAREDLDAARRIAEALRGFGVEVWFDQSELRGGDEWDEKIRRQIHQCALFLAVVSARTQARREGYFRREWKLAVERTSDMAEGVPFVVPVVIDDTAESRALVPAEFLRVQWTRLPGGLPSPQFIEQTNPHRAPPKVAQAAAPAHLNAGGPPALLKPRPHAWAWAALALAATAVLAFFATRKPPSAAAKPPLDFASAKSIAVLPFKNQSPDPENAFFTDGVHEDILTSLFNIRELHVVSRTSVEQYRDTKKPLRQIGEELRVAYLLEGSVQRVGNQVRVTGQLIDARTDRHVWAKNYDKALSDIFVIQSEIAKAIAGELRAVISPQAEKLLARKPTENPAAYDKFLQARRFKNSALGTPGARQKERELLEAATELDSRFALAWAWLAYSDALSSFTTRSPGRLAQATGAIEAAMRLAPDEPDVILCHGLYLFHVKGDYAAATKQIERVAQMQPESAWWRWALQAVQRREGRWPEALANIRRATQIEPGNTDFAMLLASDALAGRRFTEARDELRRLTPLAYDPLDLEYRTARVQFLMRGSTTDVDAFFARLSPEQARANSVAQNRSEWALIKGESQRPGPLPANAPLNTVLTAALIFAARGELASARADLERVRERLGATLKSEPENAVAWAELARIEALLGHNAEALLHARKAMDLVPESTNTSEGPGHRAKLAFVYAWTGDKDRAIAEYARLLQTPNLSFVPGLTLENVHVMKRHPAFFPLQGDPRFEALLIDPKNNAPLF